MKYTPSNMPKLFSRGMKFAAVATAAAFTALSPVNADSYATLARAGDTITLEKGETALIYSASGVIAYSAAGKQCAFLRFSENRDRTSTVAETSKYPMPLVGPAKITIRSTDGFCGMRIVNTGERAADTRARLASSAPVKSAVRP
ncbi:hypothetical protein NT6N_19200 [Oceaniferula spumae]|uniref:Uncharacterized protein n=1 Tax=Oceaniferula spumae TaxID=2979115 RepID=A0AAT9FLJ5_9BACT